MSSVVVISTVFVYNLLVSQQTGALFVYCLLKFCDSHIYNQCLSHGISDNELLGNSSLLIVQFPSDLTQCEDSQLRNH